MSSSRAGPVPSRTGVRSMITVTYLSPRWVCRHNVLIDPDHGDALEPGDVVDEHPAPLGQDRVVGGVPGVPEPLGDAGHAQVLTHDAF